MTDNTTTTTDLPPFFADLGEESYKRGVAAIVSSSILGNHVPFKSHTSLIGAAASSSVTPGEVATAVVDLAEWITTGLHPLADWTAEAVEAAETRLEEEETTV